VPPLAKLVDRDLERIVVVSACHLMDMTTRQLNDLLSTDDFNDGDSRRIWKAFEAVVAERDGWVPSWQVVVEKAGMDHAEWHRYADGVPWVTSGEVVAQAARLADLGFYRRAVYYGRGVQSMVEAGVPADEILEHLRDNLESLRAVVPERPLPRTLADIVGDPAVAEAPEKGWDWLIEDWIERRDRVMLTGGEGLGKMTLFREWATQAAVGFHPWTGAKIRPLVSLVLDLQDGQVRNERALRAISAQAHVDHVDTLDLLYTESWPQGLNILSSQRDRRDLESIIRSVRPELLFIGPIYRLAMKSDRREGSTAQGICDFIDTMRARYDVAVFMEAHSPHAKPGTPQANQPYGGREFMYWPDAGYGLVAENDDGTQARLKPFRGNRDKKQKYWPERLVYGERWPWVPKGAPASVVELRAAPRRVLGQPVRVADPEPEPETEFRFFDQE
jgi:hypothetical protein